MIATIIKLIKNPKNLAIGILGVLAILACAGMVYYKVSKDSLIKQYQKEKIQMYENMVKENKAHAERLQKISNETSEITKKIKNLNLTKEKCQDEVYYNTANDITNRFNGVR